MMCPTPNSYPENHQQKGQELAIVRTAITYLEKYKFTMEFMIEKQTNDHGIIGIHD
jgi:hypothetical protein